jgi:Uma2 family endonuclease
MSVAMEDWPRRHRITVDEYHRMAEEGLLAPDARVELIEGEIVEMPPIGTRHAAAVDLLGELLHAAIGQRAIVRCQGPIRLDDFSEPQPDFAVLVRRDDFYRERHPTAADVLLAIEVSDSSLSRDRVTKAALYAGHGIREYWVIDVETAKIHVFRAPQGAGYGEARSPSESAVLTLSWLPDTSVDVSLLFR